MAGTRLNEMPGQAHWMPTSRSLAPGSLYADPGFNAAIRSYFLRLADQKTTRIAWQDATLELPELARLAEAQLRQIV